MMADLVGSNRRGAVWTGGSPRPAVYSIRALETSAELIASYQLRYEMYRQLGYVEHHDARLEIDEYDMTSIPFGAFDPVTGALVGTLRVITTVEHPEYKQLLLDMLDDMGDPELSFLAWRARRHRLPTIVSDRVDHQIDAFNTERFMIHEMSRFIVRPEYRASNVSHGLAIMAIAHAMQNGPAVLIASCLPRHVPLYAKYGFAKLPHTDREYFDSVGQIANAIICRSDALPRPLLADVNALLGAMASGIPEHTHELSRDVRALFRLATHRPRRTTMEW
jgi:predicted GNAT family N-acyltransferase